MKHFRFYEDAAKDDRVLSLPTDTLRWQWIVLLCLAARHDGVIPSIEMAALALGGLPTTKTAIVIAALHRASLIEVMPGGRFQPTRWQGGQPFGSDISTARVLKFKRARDQRLKNVSATATESTFRPIGDAAVSVVDRLGEHLSVVSDAESTR